MKKNLTILGLLLVTLTGHSQSIDCEKFKNGTFYYPTLPNKISIRKDAIQESYNNGKLEMIWKVNWLNACQYEMTCERVLVEPYQIQKGDKIVVTITKTEGDCFSFSLIFYNNTNPQGYTIPSGEMCIKQEYA